MMTPGLDPTIDPTLMVVDGIPRLPQGPHGHSVCAGNDPTVDPTHPTPPHPTFPRPPKGAGTRWEEQREARTTQSKPKAKDTVKRNLVRYSCFGVLGACWLVMFVHAGLLLVQLAGVNG